LDKESTTYIGGILEMFNARLYGFWGHLTEALQTGSPQNEIKQTGKPMFVELYKDSARLEQFMHAMEGISLGNFHVLVSSSTSPCIGRCATWGERQASFAQSSPTVIRI
jgi:hypothetical protein